MSFQSPRHRLLFLALALLVTLVVTGLGGTSFQHQVQDFRPLGFEPVAEGDLFRATHVTHEVGLREGDVLMVVGPDAPDSSATLQRRLRSSDSTTVFVKRGELFESVAYQRPGLEIDSVYLILVAIGLFYLLIGLYTGLKERHSRAHLFFFWCATSAALYLLSPDLPPQNATERTIFLVDQAARSILPALTLHLFLLFPAPLWSVQGIRRALPLVYAPSLALLAWHTSQIFFQGRWVGGPATIAQVWLVDRLELILLVGLSLLSAIALFAHLQRRPDWQQRKQVQWILFGLVAGYVPFLLIYLLPLTLGFGTPTWSTTLAVLPLAFVPLAFAYAIFKYRLLDLTAIMRDIASYSAAGVVGVFGFRLAQVMIDSGVADELALARNTLTFAAGLMIAGALIPTKNAVSSGLERLQHRGLWARRRLLAELGHDLLFERDLDRLCATLVEHLEESLLTRIDLFLRQGTHQLTSVRDPSLHVSSEGDPHSVPMTLDLRDLGEDFWMRESQSISAAQLPDDSPSTEQLLYARGYRYAFPMKIQQQPVALLVMSYKYDEDPLDGEDLELVRGLLNQAALAIENARLLDEVRHQLGEVQRLEAWNEGILQSSPSGIAVLDAHQRIVSANDSFAALVGLSSSRLPGRRVTDVLPVFPLPTVDTGLVEVGYCDPAGNEHYLQLDVASYCAAETGSGRGIKRASERSPGPGDGHVVLVARDVSEKVNMELQLKEKEHLASLGMLAAGVAHEVNTPLTGISSYAQFLMADLPPDDPRYAILQKMEKQTFRASQIVNSLLDFSRNRRGEMGRVALDAVLVETLQLLEMRAQEDGVHLVLDPPAEPLYVFGNEGELHQVFTNLLGNAIDALKNPGKSEAGRFGAGGIGAEATSARHQVTIRLEPVESHIRATISDNGPGIPPERLATIFKPFFSSKLGKGGTGLGLAITYNIVRRHGGEIRAENHGDGNSGCTFTVELPSYQAITS